MAYEIIKRLKQNNAQEMLRLLAKEVEATRKVNNKLHEVWELSFDWKECIGKEFTYQKLDYMHTNPCAGKWMLSKTAVDYPYSSAKFYTTGEQGVYTITNFMEMEDVDLGKTKGQ